MTQTIRLSDMTVYAEPPPGLGGGGSGQGSYIGGGFSTSGGYLHGVSGTAPIPGWYFQYLEFISEKYYHENQETDNRHYEDPESDRSLVEAMAKHLISETGKFSGYMADMLNSQLSRSEFDALKSAGNKGEWRYSWGC